jgi:DNA-binding NarL/FixJ family response regulator
MIRVILADDHHLVRQGIRALIDRADDLIVIGETADGFEAITLVQQLVPDVLVMDLSMPRLNGIQALERLTALGISTAVIILSVHSDPSFVHQAFRNGAKGYLLKSSVVEELLVGIRAASQGNTYLSPAVSTAVLTDFLASTPDTVETTPIHKLSPREREVLKLIAEGHTNSGIATILNVSVKTIEKHRANIMSKLSVHDTAGLVRMALKFGLIFIDQ